MTGGGRIDVCVRGQGAVGMALALALAGTGLRVALQRLREGPARPADVRAWALNEGSVDLLRRVKVWDALPVDARTAVHDMRIEGDEPGAALGFSAWALHREQLAWIVDAAALEAALAEALRYAPHVTAVDAPVAAGLLVVAEGRDAASRAELGVSTAVHRYGHHGVAARLVADLPHAGLARQWFRSPEVLALLPFDRPLPGSSYGLVWSVPQARAEELLALDAAAFGQAVTEATRGLAGTLTLDGERAAWPLIKASSSPLCGPGWVVVGDAAHVVHPLAGQGLNLGLADVVSLVQVLAAREPWRALGDERLLRRHVRQRHLPTLAMGRLTDGLFELFAHESTAVRSLRNRGLTLLDHLSPVKRMLAARAFHS